MLFHNQGNRRKDGRTWIEGFLYKVTLQRVINHIVMRIMREVAQERITFKYVRQVPGLGCRTGIPATLAGETGRQEVLQNEVKAILGNIVRHCLK